MGRAELRSHLTDHIGEDAADNILEILGDFVRREDERFDLLMVRLPKNEGDVS